MLGPERLKNMELILGKLRMSNTQIVESLYKLDEDVLKPAIVDSLIGAMPNETETNLWPDADTSNLAIPDIFCINILTVKGYDSRLLALRFKYGFQDLADDLKSKICIF